MINGNYFLDPIYIFLVEVMHKKLNLSNFSACTTIVVHAVSVESQQIFKYITFIYEKQPLLTIETGGRDIFLFVKNTFLI